MDTHTDGGGDTADDFLKEWGEMSGKDVFERRMFLERFGSAWLSLWNKNVPNADIFAHKLFNRSFSTLLPYIPKNFKGSALTVSGGVGKTGLRVARGFSGSSMTITAVNKKSYEVTKVLISELGLTNVTAMHEDPSHLSFGNAVFDLVFFDVAEGSITDDDIGALKEVRRVLKPGGIIMTTAVNSQNFIHWLYSFFAGKGFSYSNPKSFSKSQVSDMFRKAGLSVSEAYAFEPGYTSYILESTPPLLRLFGNAIDGLARGLDRLLSQAFMKNFGTGLLVLGAKPIDKNEAELKAMAEIVEQVQTPLPSDKDLKRVEIIVLKYKDPEVESICAKHILENTEWPYKMNFFDNRPGTKNMSKAWNKLIRESTCDYLIIMDSDVFVPKLSPCWLTRLMGNFENSDCFVSLPKVTVTSCPEQRAQKSENKPAYEIRARFAGMCTLYKKEVFEKVGYFDEDFLLRGSDVEWVDRLQKSLCKAYISPDVLVDHVGSYASKKANKKAEFSRDLERIYANTVYNKKRS